MTKKTESKTRAPRIQWTESEWEQLTREAAEIKNALGCGPFHALKKASQILPEHRRRHIVPSYIHEARLARISEKAAHLAEAPTLGQMELPDPGPGEVRSKINYAEWFREISDGITRTNQLLEVQNKHLVAIGHAANIALGHVAGLVHANGVHHNGNGNGHAPEPDPAAKLVAALQAVLLQRS